MRIDARPFAYEFELPHTALVLIDNQRPVLDQVKASYAKGTTKCKGSCNPAATYGWDALNWKFKFGSSTGTLTGVSGGVKTVIQSNMAISVTEGACAVVEGGKSVLAR